MDIHLTIEQRQARISDLLAAVGLSGVIEQAPAITEGSDSWQLAAAAGLKIKPELRKMPLVPTPEPSGLPGADVP
jgi:hypothetical protein